MDYYDDYRSSRPRRSKGFGVFWTSILSAIFGGLFVLLMVPYMVEHGILKVEIRSSEGVSQGGPKAVEAMGTAIENNNDTEDKLSLQEAGNPKHTVVEAVNQVRPAVVGVINVKNDQSGISTHSTTLEAGWGTGVIFEESNGKAKIVTNYHVISGAREIVISLPSFDS